MSNQIFVILTVLLLVNFVGQKQFIANNLFMSVNSELSARTARPALGMVLQIVNRNPGGCTYSHDEECNPFPKCPTHVSRSGRITRNLSLKSVVLRYKSAITRVCRLCIYLRYLTVSWHLPCNAIITLSQVCL